MGDDVIYSGTVAAAMEDFLGLPRSQFQSRIIAAVSAAAHVAAELVANLSDLAVASETILNVNVPDVALDELAGYELARLGSDTKLSPFIRCAIHAAGPSIGSVRQDPKLTQSWYRLLRGQQRPSCSNATSQ